MSRMSQMGERKLNCITMRAGQHAPSLGRAATPKEIAAPDFARRRVANGPWP
jgi:hypothetical protein